MWLQTAQPQSRPGRTYCGLESQREKRRAWNCSPGSFQPAPWPLIWSITSLHPSDPLQQASPQQKFKALSHSSTRQNLRQQQGEMEGSGEKLLCHCTTLGTPLQGVRQQSQLCSGLILSSKGESSKEEAGENQQGFPLSNSDIWKRKDTSSFLDCMDT